MFVFRSELLFLRRFFLLLHHNKDWAKKFRLELELPPPSSPWSANTNHIFLMEHDSFPATVKDQGTLVPRVLAMLFLLLFSYTLLYFCL
jgi:hypothetical protein